jgi:hypothetical protein
LKAYAEAVEEAQAFFISYRHGESDDLVRIFVEEIGKLGTAYWLGQEMIRYQSQDQQDRLPQDRLGQIYLMLSGKLTSLSLLLAPLTSTRIGSITSLTEPVILRSMVTYGKSWRLTLFPLHTRSARLLRLGM